MITITNDTEALKIRLQSRYRGADSGSGGVQVEQVYQNPNTGIITYLTSECRMHYFKAGRACQRTKMHYDVITNARFDNEGCLEIDPNDSESKYHFTTKSEATRYYKSLLPKRTRMPYKPRKVG